MIKNSYLLKTLIFLFRNLKTTKLNESQLKPWNITTWKEENLECKRQI